MPKYILLGHGYPEIKEAMIYGYPDDLNRPFGEMTFKQFGATGPIARIEREKIYHVIDTNTGQSGSPILC